MSTRVLKANLDYQRLVLKTERNRQITEDNRVGADVARNQAAAAEAVATARSTALGSGAAADIVHSQGELAAYASDPTKAGKSVFASHDGQLYQVVGGAAVYRSTLATVAASSPAALAERQGGPGAVADVQGARAGGRLGGSRYVWRDTATTGRIQRPGSDGTVVVHVADQPDAWWESTALSQGRMSVLDHGVGVVNALDEGVAGGERDDTEAMQRAMVTAHAYGMALEVPDGVTVHTRTLQYYPGQRLGGRGTLALVGGLAVTPGNLTILRPAQVDQRGLQMTELLLDQRGREYGYDGHNMCISVDRTVGTRLVGVWFDDVVTMATWCDTKHGHVTRDLLIALGGILKSMSGGHSYFGNLLWAKILGETLTHIQDDPVAYQDLATGEYPRWVSAIGCTIADCTGRNASGSTAHGILDFGAHHFLAADNTIDGTVSSSVMVTGGASQRARHALVADNIMDRAGAADDGSAGYPLDHVTVLGADHVVISGGEGAGCRGAGVAIGDSTHVAVEGGSYVEPGTAIVRIEDSSDVSIVTPRGHNPRGLVPTERAGIVVIANTRDCERITITGPRITSDDGAMEYGILTSVNQGRAIDIRVDGGHVLGWTEQATTLVSAQRRGLITRSGVMPSASGSALIRAGADSVAVQHGLGAVPEHISVDAFGPTRVWPQGRTETEIVVLREGPFDQPVEIFWSVQS